MKIEMNHEMKHDHVESTIKMTHEMKDVQIHMKQSRITFKGDENGGVGSGNGNN